MADGDDKSHQAKRQAVKEQAIDPFAAINRDEFKKGYNMSLQSRTLSHMMAVPASRVQPLVDDAGGDDKSHQAKRQAVEKFVEKFDVATQWNESDLSVDESDLSVDESSAEFSFTDLPPEVLGLVAGCLDRQSIKPMLSTCSTWRAQGSSPEFWHALCEAHYPRVPHMLESMPKPHPPWRQLYLQQLRAERPLRAEAAAPPTTSLSDYACIVEIRGENGTPLTTKYGTLGTTDFVTKGNGFCFVKLWDEDNAPIWANTVVEDFRTIDEDYLSGNDSAAWMDSDGRRLASALRLTIFIMRPGGDTFCLYDGFLDQRNGKLSIDDDDEDDEDLFDMNFENAPLPLAGAAALDIRGRCTLSSHELEPILSLLSKGLHSDEDDPLYDPAKPNGNLAGDGELHLAFDSDPEVRDDDIVRYFEWFAPF